MSYYDVQPNNFTPVLKRKYAHMWACINKWLIPDEFDYMEEPKEIETPLNGDPFKTAYWSGMYAVLNALCEDGILPDTYLDKAEKILEKELEKS